VLTVSDGVVTGVREDTSGGLLEERLRDGGFDVQRRTVPDERPLIVAALRELAAEADLVLTTGGTGFAPRDVTPEATAEVVDRRTPGLDEAMRTAAMKATPHGMLSRQSSGIAGRSLIVNMPGSPRACAECYEVIAPALEHGLALILERPTEH
jgi:molybdopterin adenylyltransferase